MLLTNTVSIAVWYGGNNPEWTAKFDHLVLIVSDTSYQMLDSSKVVQTNIGKLLNQTHIYHYTSTA